MLLLFPMISLVERHMHTIYRHILKVFSSGHTYMTTQTIVMLFDAMQSQICRILKVSIPPLLYSCLLENLQIIFAGSSGCFMPSIPAQIRCFPWLILIVVNDALNMVFMCIMYTWLAWLQSIRFNLSIPVRFVSHLLLPPST